MSEGIRTFIAVELPSEVRDTLGSLQQELGDAHGQVRWVAPHNIHLTLKFLGNIPEERVSPLREGTEEAAAGYAPFGMSLMDLGAFPGPRRARVIWVGLDQGRELLGALAERLEASLADRGFDRESRRFKPHVTIGRIKGRGRGVDMSEPLAKVTFDVQTCVVDGLTIMRSDLTPHGPIYTPLHRVLLASERAEDNNRCE
ncbi:hypothetical protein AMJ82_12455 [candidate division TA06 bacterium SM23_40]|uniref:RNA 2',3'-cyclic phosphodiesterase n=1 Tax=candidate division TA06 bacterium SM23_40 TaxID=1703774 RepID=A0A0S8FX06_UNCT6|nr:MAG: hypothetical protein AMJ82_12455 [candidate division TA06 bacterium SM23_40]